MDRATGDRRRAVLRHGASAEVSAQPGRRRACRAAAALQRLQHPLIRSSLGPCPDGCVACSARADGHAPPLLLALVASPFAILRSTNAGTAVKPRSALAQSEWLFDPTIGKLVVAVLGIAAFWALGRLLKRSINRYVADTSSRYTARKLVTFLFYVACGVLVATVYSDRLAGLTVAFGVAGAGIAFALQEVIASIAGWVAISFGGFYSTDDRVQLGGIKGDVIDIGVLRTTVMEMGQWVSADLYNGRIVRIANSFVFKEPVFNYSADFPFLWDEITLPVRYGSNWKLAKEMLTKVAEEVCGDYAVQSRAAWREAVEKYRLEDAKVEPMVHLEANDNWLQFTLRYVVDYRRRRSVKDQLFTRILEEVDASGDKIRLASATFEVVNLPKFDVSFAGGKGEVRSSYLP